MSIGFYFIIGFVLFLIIGAICYDLNYNKLWDDFVRKVPKLFLGFLFLSLGIFLTKYSTLGMSSWSVFHDGLSNVTKLTFGEITQIVGLVVMVLSMLLLKTKIGLGTIMNMVFVGMMIDGFEVLFPKGDLNLMIQVIVLTLGVLFTTFGRSLYIASRLGPGPRDGLFVGLARVTHIQVRYIKISIELIVLVIGFVLGGTAGVGTIIIIIVSGYMVQFFFKLLHFDPKTEKQHNILEYIKK